MPVRCIVYTCKEYSDVLPGFAYLFNVFWSAEQPVAYAGCPKMNLPANFQWHNVESRIAERWSDGLIELLNKLDDSIVCWLLEDYYLVRKVDNGAIESLAEYMRIHSDILKIDLTGDRLYSGKARDVDYWGHLDLILTPWETPYQFSIQAALWNRRHLLSLLRPEMSPWDFELQDVRSEKLYVLGTRQWPLRYLNFLGMGLEKNEYRIRHERQGNGGTTIEQIPADHLDHMRKHKLLPEKRKLNERNR